MTYSQDVKTESPNPAIMPAIAVVAHHLKNRGIVSEIADWRIATDPEGGVKINLLLRSSQEIENEAISALKQTLERILKKQVALDVAVIPVDLIQAE